MSHPFVCLGTRTLRPFSRINGDMDDGGRMESQASDETGGRRTGTAVTASYKTDPCRDTATTCLRHGCYLRMAALASALPRGLLCIGKKDNGVRIQRRARISLTLNLHYPLLVPTSHSRRRHRSSAANGPTPSPWPDTSDRWSQFIPPRIGYQGCATTKPRRLAWRRLGDLGF
jgi:hypothetical protein